MPRWNVEVHDTFRLVFEVKADTEDEAREAYAMSEPVLVESLGHDRISSVDPAEDIEDDDEAAGLKTTPREVVAGYLADVARLDAQVQEARGKGRNHAANAYAQEAEDYFEEATGVARQSEDPVALAMVEVADVRRQSVAYGVSPSSQAVRLADLLAKLIEVAP